MENFKIHFGNNLVFRSDSVSSIQVLADDFSNNLIYLSGNQLMLCEPPVSNDLYLTFVDEKFTWKTIETLPSKLTATSPITLKYIPDVEFKYNIIEEANIKY